MDQRLRRRHDPELLSGLVDHADLTDPDALVGPHAVVAARTEHACGSNAITTSRACRYGVDRCRLSAWLLSAISSSASAMNASTAARPEVAAAAAADRHRPLGRLPIADHQHVRHLLQLGLADLVANLLLPRVQLDPQPGGRQPVATTARA